MFLFIALVGLWLPLPAPPSTGNLAKIARPPPLPLLYARGADSGDPVDEDRVYALIEEREGLRKSRDYAAADDVRDELSRMGVTLWDRDRVWMCGTGAPPSRQAPDAPRFSPDGPARRGDRKFTGAFRGAERGQGYRKGPAEFRERFAETKIFVENLSFETDWMALKDHFIDAGYPTVYASVSYDKERGRSKGCGIVQFETVDAMNAAVEQMTGSMLDGRSINCRPDAKGNQRGGGYGGDRGGGGYGGGDDGWGGGRAERAPPPQRDRNGYGGERGGGGGGGGGYGRDDGRGRGAFAANERGRKGLDERRKLYDAYGHDYTRHDDDATSLAGDELAQVNVLLARRLEAKLSKDYDAADGVLAELGRLGVTVNDGTYQWRADGQPFIHRYKRIGGGGGGVDDGRVETLLADRADARRERNYRLADGIRDELFEMGVEMDDKQRTWWVVGGGNVRPHDYARADDDGGTFVDGAQLAEIDQLISERLAAKKERDFDTADRLQEQLRYLGVEMDDRERVWRYKYDGGRQY